MSKSWYDVSQDWVLFGCEDCGSDFYFAVERKYAELSNSIACPLCGDDCNTFRTGEKIDGAVVGDDWHGEVGV